MATEQTGTGKAAVERLAAARGAENFPVALRVLPARYRRRLVTIYDVVRTIDDLGDEGAATPEARLAALAGFRADLGLAFAAEGGPEHPVLRALVPVAAECGLTAEPFEQLIEANVADQLVSSYETWEQLLGYCALSAAPIGRLVLAAFEVPGGVPGSTADADLLRRSDAVCNALQLLEHLQDVAEDHARGRVYLPADALAATGASAADLDAAEGATPPAVRAAVRELTGRALALLDEGAPIVGSLHGWARLAVAGYVAGGRAAGDALRRVDGDVLGQAARAARTGRRDVVRHLVATLLPGRVAR